MSQYEGYKQTGLTWLPEIPQNWKWCFLSQVAKEQTIKKPADEMYPVLTLTYGEIKRKKNINSGLVPSDYGTYQMLYKGNIVLRLIDLQNDHTSLRTGLVKETGIITSAYTCIASTENAAYLHYLLHSYDTKKVFYGYGGGVRQSIGFKDIRYLQVPIPPREEQEQIVRFLDWKISSINRLINNQRKQIQVIEEMKERVVCEVLLHGIDAAALQKDSGVKWIGLIPARWKVIKIKWLFEEVNERNTDETAELLTFSKKRGLIPFSEASEKMPSASDLSNYKLLRKGQLLENRMQAWHGMFICADREGCVSPDYSVFSVAKERKVNVKFYEYVFRSHIWVEQFANASRGVGTGFNRLYTPQFGAIYTVYPELNEQNQIVEYLDKKMEQLNVLVRQIEKRIECLGELKTTLISDAVTGKIDVRDIEIPAYELVEESAEVDAEETEELQDWHD